MIDAKHPDRGDCYSRVEHNPREAAFAKEWERINKRNRGVNYGYGLLQDLFMEPDKTMGRLSPHARHIVTPSERMVAATAIQWLGSNVGFSFLMDALDKCGYKITKTQKP